MVYGLTLFFVRLTFVSPAPPPLTACLRRAHVCCKPGAGQQGGHVHSSFVYMVYLIMPWKSFIYLFVLCWVFMGKFIPLLRFSTEKDFLDNISSRRNEFFRNKEDSYCFYRLLILRTLLLSPLFWLTIPLLILRIIIYYLQEVEHTLSANPR